MFLSISQMRRKTVINLNELVSHTSLGNIKPTVEDIHIALLREGFENFPEAEKTKAYMSKSFKRRSFTFGLEIQIKKLTLGLHEESMVTIKKVDSKGLIYSVDIYE